MDIPLDRLSCHVKYCARYFKHHYGRMCRPSIHTSETQYAKKKKECAMITKKLSEVGIMENAHNVDARNLYNTEDAMITVIALEPGHSLKRHITPVDVAFYVLEGTGVVEIGDEKMEVTKDTLVESPKDIVHCWYNESSDPLRFMVIKAPKPKKKTVFVGD